MDSSSAITETSRRSKEKQAPLYQEEEQQRGKISTVNPATEEIISQYEIMVKDQINERVKKAQKTFEEWKKDLNKRIDYLHDLASELERTKKTLLEQLQRKWARS